MKSLALTTLCALGRVSGAMSWPTRFHSSEVPSSLVVLLFHRVTDDIPQDGLTVGTRFFRQLCQILRDRFRVLTLTDAVAAVRGGQPIPSRSIAITFDDCYRDNLGAAHVLAEHGLPASFFVPTQYVGTDHVFPWDVGLKRQPNLDWDDVRAMVKLGHEIGSHTVHHTDMAAIAEALARRELMESKQTIEDQVGKPVRWLALPFGRLSNCPSDRVLSMIGEAGYEACFSGHGGSIPAGTPSLILPRLPVSGFHNPAHVELYLSGALKWVHTLNRKARQVVGAIVAPESSVPPAVTCESPAPSCCPGQSSSLRVEVVKDVQGLIGYLSDWRALADCAMVRNPFYEPWMLLPALQHLAPEGEFFSVLIHEDLGSQSRLCGFFPLLARSKFKELPIRVLELWRHQHCFFCTPLLHPSHPGRVLSAFFSWARNDPRGAPLVDMQLVNGDGPLQGILEETCREDGLRLVVAERFSRALLMPTVATESYLLDTLSTANYRELRRKRRRLTELGQLEVRSLGGDDQVETWIEQFLALESSGWKGRNGTALAADPGERSYFRRMVLNGATERKVALLGLFLDGRPIAMKCNLLSPPGAFAFKICYAEDLAGLSPGAQLELDNIQWLQDQPALEWMDSCAIPGHFMIERLWKERREMQSFWMSTGRPLGNAILAGLPLARASRRWLRQVRGVSQSKGDS